jgi:hypothetical protein
MRYFNDLLLPIAIIREISNGSTRPVYLCVQATQTAEGPWVAVRSATEIQIAIQVRLVYLVMIEDYSTVQDQLPGTAIYPAVTVPVEI